METQARRSKARSAFLQLHQPTNQQVHMAITWFPPSVKLVSQCRVDESHRTTQNHRIHKVR